MFTPTSAAGAVLSSCKQYRYALWRVWNVEEPLLTFIMLNPSTADETHDDATIRRCIARAKLLGFGGILIGNLFAYRATNPSELYETADPIGLENDLYLHSIKTLSGKIICAWGKHGAFKQRHDAVKKLFAGAQLYCLKLNQDKSPAHPLYIMLNSDLIPF